MICETFAEGGRAAQAVLATRLVVRDDHGNPICVVIEFLAGGEGETAHYVHQVLRPDDPEFGAVLEALGTKASRLGRKIVLSGS